MTSVFTRIINGEIPSYKIYEDEYVYAFLDINPVNVGHTLIVPKIEIDYFIDVPEPYYTAVFQAAKTIARAIQETTQCRRVCAWIEGFEVPHWHYHVCPIYDNEFRMKRGKSADPEELKSMQEKILTHLVS